MNKETRLRDETIIIDNEQSENDKWKKSLFSQECDTNTGL